MGTIGKDESQDSNRRQKPPAVVLAKAAAYIDGEGCISIGRTTQGKNPNPAFFLHVLVDNTDPRLPYWLLGQFGGRVHELPITPHNKKNKRLRFRWQISARNRLRFLHWIRPHILLKGEQIDVAIRFLVLQSHAPYRGPVARDESYIVRLTECFEKLRELRTDRFLRSVHPQRLSEAAPN